MGISFGASFITWHAWGASGIYISMWGEYDEGNQIAKTAPDQSWVPSNGNFVTTDEDGVWCTSDYYLRLTNDGERMLRGEIALTPTRPTQPFAALYEPDNHKTLNIL